MSEQLTHWKRLRNPDYFGAYAMPTDGSEIVLTIKSARQENVMGTDGKKSECLVIYFQENVKPMILNSTNAKAISKVAKSNFIEKWAGTKIQIYVARIRAFGEDVEALRVRQTAPNLIAKAVQPISQDLLNEVLGKLDKCESLDDLKDVYSSLDKQMQSHPEVISLKDTLKSQLP